MIEHPRHAGNARSLVLSWFSCVYLAGLGGSLGAQEPLPGPPGPGLVLVDDMWLPLYALGEDGHFDGPAWGGSVPYAIHSSVTPAHLAGLQSAIEYLEAVCGVDFVPYSGQADYILVRVYSTMGNTGNSQVGMSGGEQELRMGPQFTNPIPIMHELIHALGFKHEQSRSDRDTYVTINSGNIGSFCGTSGTGSCAPNFEIFSGGILVGPYDFLSVMHYSRTQFSSNGQDTISCQPGYTAFASLMGLGQCLSYGDANMLIARYGPTPVHPVIDGINPSAVAENSGNTTIRIYGSGFYRGSIPPPAGSGIPLVTGVVGSQVLVNGVHVGTQNLTYVNSTELQVTVPALWFVNPGCLEIRVENAFGGTSLPWYLGVTPATPSAGFWTGGELGALAGSAVAGLGDVNGDGYDDVVVGAFGTSYGGTQYGGRVSCFSGRDGATLWSKLGPAPQGHGTALANAGDIDGDGIDDVLDGAPGTYGATGYGNAIIRSGVDGWLIRTYVSLVLNDGFGNSVANAGDVNQDGVPDQIVGVPNSDQARIYSGADGSPIRTLSGAAATRFGWAVAGGFDLTGDGIPDQAVGAPHYPSSNRGRVYLYNGATGALVVTFFGDTVGDRLGFSLAMMPSPDGSLGGAPVAGAPGSTSSVTGYARIIGPFGAGGSSGYPVLDTLTGGGLGDRFGWSVAAAGDLDQDGRMDIAVGAPEAASGAGHVRIHSGRTGALMEYDYGGASGESFGWSVAAAGDTNGDGVPDLVAGAVGASLGCLNSGYARTIHRIVPPAQKKVMVTEVFWGQPAGVEITNFDSVAVSVAGWRLIWDDGTRHVSSPIPAGTMMAPGTSLLVKEPQTGITFCPCTAATFFSEAPPSTPYFTLLPAISTGPQTFAVGLQNHSGIVQDEVRIAPDTGGFFPLAGGGAGGHFRGKAPRHAATVSVERIGGLDSNSAGDWTSEYVRSFGLENRSAGIRGSDAIPVPAVVINEIDDTPAYVELRNRNGSAVDLRNWFLRASGGQGLVHRDIRPFPYVPFLLNDNLYAVLGNGSAAPAEMPGGIPYFNLLLASGSQTFPFTSDEYDCALYDAYGRLVDLVRTTGHDDLRSHNHPRAPAPWSEFGGAAVRSAFGSGAIGRTVSDPDTDSGADWRPIFNRTMGFGNSATTYGGLPGLGHAFDVRMNETAAGGGVAIILNAGLARAGHHYSFFYSVGHLNGAGPFYGLGTDAILNWMAINTVPPWAGVLDSRGSARIDLPPGLLPPGVASDHIFILQNPSGGLVFRTPVIEFDT